MNTTFIRARDEQGEATFVLQDADPSWQSAEYPEMALAMSTRFSMRDYRVWMGFPGPWIAKQSAKWLKDVAGMEVLEVRAPIPEDDEGTIY